MNKLKEAIREMYPFLNKEIIGMYTYKKKGRGNHSHIQFIITPDVLNIDLIRMTFEQIYSHGILNAIKNGKILSVEALGFNN